MEQVFESPNVWRGMRRLTCVSSDADHNSKQRQRISNIWERDASKLNDKEERGRDEKENNNGIRHTNAMSNNTV